MVATHAWFVSWDSAPKMVRGSFMCTKPHFVSLVTYVHLVMLRFRQIFHVDQPPAGEQLLVTEFAPMGSLVDALEELCDEDGDSLLTETHKVYL